MLLKWESEKERVKDKSSHHSQSQINGWSQKEREKGRYLIKS